MYEVRAGRGAPVERSMLERSARIAGILAAVMVWSGLATAPAPAAEPIYWKDRACQIPFRKLDPVRVQRLIEMQLYVSTDGGRSWRHWASARPNDERFTVDQLADGEYWFALVSVDREGRRDPPTLTNAIPELRMVVDTTPPQIAMRPVHPSGDEAGVEWDVRDEHLEPRSIRIEWRSQAAPTWQPLAAEPAASGRKTWRVDSAAPLQVRLSAADKAGNSAAQEVAIQAPRGIPAVGGPDAGIPTAPLSPSGVGAPTRLSQPNTSWPTVPIAPPSPAIGQPVGSQRIDAGQPGPRWNTAPQLAPRLDRKVAPAAKVELVSSNVFDINYEAENVGKSGLGTVTLYWTHDTMSWTPWETDDDRESPFAVRVDGEGVYGFTIVATSGVGVGGDPPRPGEPPQIWVEVDMTSPEILLNPPEPGQGPREGILSITWQAHDRNLDSKPITIAYAESLSGPWNEIAKDLENTTRYQWAMPKDVPFQFYVRIEARDRAGNVGRAHTERPVIVDLARPRIKVLRVAPKTYSE